MYHHKRLPQCAMPLSKTSGFSNSCGKSTMNWRNKRAPVDVHVAVCFTKPTIRVSHEVAPAKCERSMNHA